MVFSIYNLEKQIIFYIFALGVAQSFKKKMKFKIPVELILNSEQIKQAQKFINKEFIGQETVNIINENKEIVPDPNITVIEEHKEAHHNIYRARRIYIEAEIDKYGNFKNMKIL